MKEINETEFMDLIFEIYNKQKGKIPNLERIWCWYPDFLAKKELTNDELFFNEGSLSPELRQYIAIIVHNLNKIK